MSEPGNTSGGTDADRAEQEALLEPAAPATVGGREASEADVLEQAADVPLDEDDAPA